MRIFICNFNNQNLRWNEVLAALSKVSSKYSKFVSIISNVEFRSRMPDGSQFTIRDLPKSADFEYNLLLLLSKSVVLSAAREVYACIELSSERTAIQRNNPNARLFFSHFMSCIRGYKRLVDVMRYMRRQVMVKALRRLQGALLISKVYVNCLVSRCWVAHSLLLSVYLITSFICFECGLTLLIRSAFICQKKITAFFFNTLHFRQNSCPYF